MRRDEVLRILREHRHELAQFRVTSLALFGSVARDEARADSDVELLVEFERPAGIPLANWPAVVMQAQPAGARAAKAEQRVVARGA